MRIACASALSFCAALGYCQGVPAIAEVSPAVARATLAGHANPTQTICLAIGLQPRFPKELQAFADSVSNPASPAYRHFITPEEVGERFGASAPDVTAVVGYLRSQGMTVTLVAKNHMAVCATATIAEAEAAFGTRINSYVATNEAGKRVAFFANAMPVTFPAKISMAVKSIAGLESYSHGQPGGSILTPMLARTLYNSQPSFAAGFHGEGRNLAIVNFDGYRLNNAALYIANYGLPVPPGGALSNIQSISINGFNAQTASPSGEGDLDIQMELASAPLTNITCYDAPNNGAGYVTLLTTLANNNQADIASDSWSWDISAGNATTAHNQHLAMTAQGQSYLACTNDHGTSFGGSSGGPNGLFTYPCYDPEVTLVGGTSATVNASGSRIVEDGWNNSGGGWVNLSIYFNILPNWQHGNGVPTNVNFRLSPDISLHAAASPTAFTGGWFIYYQGSLATFWGTSCGTPFCAGSLTTMAQRLVAAGLPGRLGRLNDLIYFQNGRSDIWTDILTGINGTLPDSTVSVAHPGWDSVTGWGAPNFDAFFYSVAGRPVSGTVTLSSYSASPTGIPISVELYQLGTSNLLETRSGTLNGSGQFLVRTQLAPGVYDVYIKAPHWLRRRLASQTLTSTGMTGLSCSLANGDVNGDNVVSLGDFAGLRSAFGSSPADGNWNPNADLNGDAAVTLGDFAILRGNFGQSGD